jgi:hypothetical protein
MPPASLSPSPASAFGLYLTMTGASRQHDPSDDERLQKAGDVYAGLAWQGRGGLATTSPDPLWRAYCAGADLR